MTSNAYRMSSRPTPRRWRSDPANDLFWRFDMRRLTAEEIRDSILAVTRHAEPEDVRPGRLSRDPRRGAGRPVDAGQGLGQVAARGAGAAEHLRPRQAIAPDADPRELRRRRDRPRHARPVHHDAADAGAGDAQRRLPRTTRPSSSPRGSAARRATDPRRRSRWRSAWPRRGRPATPRSTAAWP